MVVDIDSHDAMLLHVNIHTAYIMLITVLITSATAVRDSHYTTVSRLIERTLLVERT